MTLTLVFEEFRRNLSARISLEQWAGWLIDITDRYVGKITDPKLVSMILQQLVLKWTYFSSQLVRDLTIRNVTSFGSFHLLRTLFDEYLHYIVDARYGHVIAAHHITLTPSFSSSSLLTLPTHPVAQSQAYVPYNTPTPLVNSSSSGSLTNMQMPVQLSSGNLNATIINAMPHLLQQVQPLSSTGLISNTANPSSMGVTEPSSLNSLSPSPVGSMEQSLHPESGMDDFCTINDVSGKQPSSNISTPISSTSATSEDDLAMLQGDQYFPPSVC